MKGPERLTILQKGPTTSLKSIKMEQFASKEEITMKPSILIIITQRLLAIY